VIDSIPEKELKQQDEDKCKGVIFRGNRGLYVSVDGTICERASLRVLKRKSCPGCIHCGWVLDAVHEEVYQVETLLSNIQDGCLYEFRMHTSRDWESGAIESDYCELWKSRDLPPNNLH
jgi:hypothetical protein